MCSVIEQKINMITYGNVCSQALWVQQGPTAKIVFLKDLSTKKKNEPLKITFTQLTLMRACNFDESVISPFT